MRLALPLLLTGLALFGCSAKTEIVIGGKPGPIPPENSTVVSLSPSTTEIAVIATPYLRLIGKTKSCNWPPTAAGVPVVADVKPNYEKIAELAPTIILYDEGLFSAADVEKIKGLTKVTFAMKGDTVDEFCDQIFALGKATLQETDTSAYVDKIVAAKNASEAEPLNPKPKIAVVLVSESGQHMIAGAKSFQADVMRIAGGDPVGPDGKRFEPLNPEALVQWNPDCILIGAKAESVEKLAGVLLKDPRFASVSAIKNKKIVALDEDMVVRRGGRVDRFIEYVHKQVKARMQQ